MDQEPNKPPSEFEAAVEKASVDESVRAEFRDAETLLKEAKHTFWSEIRSVIWNVVVNVVVFVAGIVLSRIMKDWMWFARSGALVTALELFLVVKRTRELIGVSFFQQEMRIAEAVANSRFLTHLDERSRQEMLGRIEERRKRKRAFEAQQNMLGRIIATTIGQLVEGGFLLTGTLVWGFGDLIGKIWK